MERIHTLRSIADDLNRNYRTVQNWYQRACSDSGVEELGELLEGTRYFNDQERAALVQYAGADRSSKNAARVEVETGNHQIVLSRPELPQQYTLENLRQSEAVTFEDPLAIANQFLQVADQLIDGMQSDIQSREQRLNKTRQAKEAIATKANELKLESRFYRERTQILDSSLSGETQALQEALATLQQMGKQPVQTVSSDS